MVDQGELLKLQRADHLLILSLPKIFEPLRGELGIPRRVLDVAMAEPLLDGACVVPVVGELKAAGVT